MRQKGVNVIRLVLSDMDGTLLPAGGDHVSYRTIQAIRALEDAGIAFAPATGRDTYDLDRLFFGARDCYQHAIAVNGKRVYVDGKLHYEALLDHSDLQVLVQMLAGVPNAFLVVEPAHNPRGQKPWYCVGGRQGDVDWFCEHVHFKGVACETLPDEPAIGAEIACAGSDDQYEALLEQARTLVPHCRFVTSQVHWSDVLPTGVSKGTGLDVLVEGLGIGLDEVVFFGDANNDLDLMAKVACSVAPSNATPEAAAAARWHIGPCAEDSVAAALEEIARAVAAGETPAFMR